VTAAGRLGWLGGTFDPIHNGHLDVARAAQHALALDQVQLVPAGRPPQRSAPSASIDHRVAMVELAAALHEWLRVSRIEIDSVTTSYTTDTLDRLAAAGVDLRSLFVITGADAFAGIMTWKDPQRLLDRCHFVAVSRPGHPAPSLRRSLPALAARMIDANGCIPPAQPSIFLVEAPTSAVSSTAVRAQAAEGRPLDGLVPPAVAAYIEQHGLYRYQRV
jgi:nicotinate-nucleotide adenylyltransferase